VIKTISGLGNQYANAICNKAEMIYPPKMPAEILANRCQEDVVKCFLLAGIGEVYFKNKRNDKNDAHLFIINNP